MRRWNKSRKEGLTLKIAHLFTVPAGEKVTEKAFLRVLISSVCSMLLCMGCLFGTTWAWFTLEIDNPQNEIQIAKVEFKELTLTRESEGVAHIDGTPITMPAELHVRIVEDGLKVLVKKRF